MNHPKTQVHFYRQDASPTAPKVIGCDSARTRQKPYGNETKEDSPNLKITFLKSAENFWGSIAGELFFQ